MKLFLEELNYMRSLDEQAPIDWPPTDENAVSMLDELDIRLSPESLTCDTESCEEDVYHKHMLYSQLWLEITSEKNIVRVPEENDLCYP